jgi:uncharacterized phage protein (TIGR01671 family)
MNRIIKFRAWDKVLKEFVFIEIPNGQINLKITSHKGMPCVSDLEDWDEYTGFKDIKNKEIYESDIIKFNTKFEGECVEEVYRDDSGMFKHTYSNRPDKAFWGSYPMEVIGNIYENPELLK